MHQYCPNSSFEPDRVCKHINIEQPGLVGNSSLRQVGLTPSKPHVPLLSVPSGCSWIELVLLDGRIPILDLNSKQRPCLYKYVHMKAQLNTVFTN